MASEDRRTLGKLAAWLEGGLEGFGWSDETRDHHNHQHLIWGDKVRRCGAAIVGAATGKVSLQDIELMLQIPSKHSWNPKLKTLPGHGLYLCNIEY